MTDTKTNTGLGLYKEAGVDVAKGDATVDWLKTSSRLGSTSPLGEVVAGIGGFAGMFRPKFGSFKSPLLVAATDGVGTKIDLAIDHDLLNGIGRDLVAMCVNDLYTIGASPLFFLDYYVTESLDKRQFKAVIEGIRAGLAEAETVLLGGETAEHPGSFPKGRFDLAGFVVGMVDENQVLKSDNVVEGDILLGFTSSGFHSNGFSLIRKWVEQRPVSRDIVEKLLTPTRIYHELPKLLSSVPGKVHGAAHITGGGLSGNICRIIPEHLTASLHFEQLPTPEWMSRFIADNNSSRREVESIFNLGIGMVLAVDRDHVSVTSEAARKVGLEPIELGAVITRAADGSAVRFVD